MSSTNNLLRHVSRWARIQGIPHKALYEYAPLAQATSDKSVGAKRKLVWSFKGMLPQENDIQKEMEERSEYSEIIIAKLEEMISETFREDTHCLTFMPLPCSTPERYEQRFKALAAKICEDLSMSNGYDAMTVCEAPEDFHQNRYVLNDVIIAGKCVLLFDDIVTTGNAAAKMKSDLEERGAEVMALVTISKTQNKEGGSSVPSY